jgi:hypothetical protein
MVGFVVTAGALFALFVLMRLLARRTPRSISRSRQLGTVSREWLHMHRAEDQ